jgi:shikimate kinase
MKTASPPEVPCPIVMVGLMGAGKTSVGKRLAARLGLPFVDADNEIEAAAGCSIPDFFSQFGEDEFRRTCWPPAAAPS